MKKIILLCLVFVIVTLSCDNNKSNIETTENRVEKNIDSTKNKSYYVFSSDSILGPKVLTQKDIIFKKIKLLSKIQSSLEINNLDSEQKNMMIILKNDSNNAEALFYQGLIFYAKKDYNNAFYYCEKSIKISDLDYNHVALSYLYFLIDSNKKAIKCIDKLLLKNDKVEYKNRRAVYKCQDEDYQGCLEDSKVIDKKITKDVQVYFARAKSFYVLKNYKQCIEEAKKSIEVDSTDFRVFRIKGYCEMYLGYPKEVAFKDIKKAYDLGDKEIEPIYNEFLNYFKNKNGK